MNRRPTMLRFLFASLCLHVVLVLPLVSTFQFAGQRETILRVTLTEIGRAIDSPTARMARHVAQKPAPPHADEKSARADDTGAIPASAQSETYVNRDVAEVSSATARGQVQAQLLVDLQRYFEYPMLARRRGWQGTVWLSFLIEPDGALQRIQVAKSSGYGSLDSSAVAAMRQVRQLGEARQLLNGQSLEMNIPVIYRLKDY